MRMKHEITVYLNSVMMQLKNGPGHINYSDSAALFVLAAIRHDKPLLDFMPTLVHFNDLKAYFKVISSMKSPIKERFILVSEHWISGEIEVTEDGYVKLFLNDSIMLVDGFAADYQSLLSQVFPEKSSQIYVSNQLRQYHRYGCSIFALTDVRILYDLNPPNADHGGLFKQLNEKIVETRTLDSNITLHKCRLPIKFLRTIQSRAVFTETEADKELIINKKRETLHESLNKSFFFNSADKQQNQRLELKLQKMADRVDRFILEILAEDPVQNFKKLIQLANEHTFDAFQNRIKIKNQKEAASPSPVSQDPEDGSAIMALL